MAACACLFLPMEMSWSWYSLCSYSVCVSLRLSFCLSGGETSGAGQAGFPQHAQEVDRLSAGPAGRGRGEKVCQVAFGKKQLNAPKHINAAKTADVCCFPLFLFMTDQMQKQWADDETIRPLQKHH